MTNDPDELRTLKIGAPAPARPDDRGDAVTRCSAAPVRPVVVQVRIAERADHWEMAWADGVETVPTAAEALAAAQERGRTLAADGGASVVAIEWEPRTAIGRRVVLALQP